jgi:MFS family permease
LVSKSDILLKLKTIFRSLKYRNYRLFFTGQSISLIGTWMQRITLPWLVYNITGSELMLGVVSFAGQLPTFLLAPFAGVITDRWSRYRVLLVTQFLSLVQASILAALTLAGSIQIWQIVILGIVFGSINAFDVPTRHSFVVQMVDNKEDLGNAIALNSLMFNGARLLGPSVAGLILAITSEGFCFLINAISYLFVIASLLMMKLNHKREFHVGSPILNELREGMNYVFGFAPIKNILLLLSVVSLTGMSYQVLMPVFASKVLQGGSETYGFLMGAAGLGALAGALHLASRKTVLRLGRLISMATLSAGTGLILLSFTKIYVPALLLMMVIGTGMMLQSAASNTILQTITDDNKRGRVMSFYTMAVMGTAPFGSLLSGTLARVIGTPATVLIFGICTITAALFFQMRLPEMRRIVRPIYVRMGIIREVAEGMQSSEEAV